MTRKNGTPSPQPPPHDEAAERALLGACILEGALLAHVLPVVSAGDFYSTAHARIFAACDTIHREGPLNEVLLLSELRESGALDTIGGAGYLRLLAADVPYLPGSNNGLLRHEAMRYAQLIAEKARERDELAASEGLVAALREGNADGIEAARALLADAQERRNGNTTPPLVAPFAPGADPVSSLAAPAGAVALQVPGLEHVRLSDELVLLGGPTSVGKSTLLVQAADRMNEAGVHVVIFAAEQTIAKWEAISLARRTGANSRRIMHGDLSDEVRAQLAAAQREWLPKVQEYRRYAPRFPSPEALVAAVEARRREVGDAASLAVILDALHNLHEPGHESRRTEVDCIADVLKERVCHRLGVPILATSHLSREGKFKESGGLDYAADLLLMLERRSGDGPSYQTLDGDTDTTRYVDGRVAKNRDGETGSFALDFRPAARLFKVGTPAPRTMPGPEPNATPRQVYEALRAAGKALSRAELAGVLNVSESTVTRRMESAEFAGWLKSGEMAKDEGKGREPDLFRYVGRVTP